MRRQAILAALAGLLITVIGFSSPASAAPRPCNIMRISEVTSAERSSALTTPDSVSDLDVGDVGYIDSRNVLETIDNLRNVLDPSMEMLDVPVVATDRSGAYRQADVQIRRDGRTTYTLCLRRTQPDPRNSAQIMGPRNSSYVDAHTGMTAYVDRNDLIGFRVLRASR